MEDMTGTESKEARQYKDILRANGITAPVSEVVIKDAGLQGEGFSSQTVCVTVTFVDSGVKPLHLFAKVLSQCEAHTVMLRDIKAFEKETRFLVDYVSAVKALWKAKGCEGSFDLFPKCYYGDSTMLVLEDLVLEQGYCMLDKAERQDLEAAKFALKTLATHHAASYALIREEGGSENFFRKYPNLDLDGFYSTHFADIMGPMFTNAVISNIGILENNDVEGGEEGLAFFKEFRNVNFVDLLRGTLKCEETDLLALNHGDYWNNNMMFLKDANTNRIIGHKAIDFQVIRYNSPTLDLGYYLYTSVQPDVRIGHFKELLEFYLTTLNKVSGDLGHPIGMTYEQLVSQFKKRLDLGFWLGMVIAVGAGAQAMKGFDVNSVEPKDWPVVWDRMMRQWMKENPESSQRIAEELVKLTREYKRISSL